jgi:hypothetical protein
MLVRGRIFYHLTRVCLDVTPGQIRHHHFDQLSDETSTSASGRGWHYSGTKAMPGILSVRAQCGFWCFAHEAIEALCGTSGSLQAPFGEGFAFAVLRKPYWVAPLARVVGVPGVDEQLLSRSSLLALVRDRSVEWVAGKNNYIHVAILVHCDSCAVDGRHEAASRAENWCEIGRGFIMDDRWPQHLDRYS